ncbi:MAG: hypothetical protein ABIO70_14375 [Pseudomonadota bacterium]
MRRALPLLAAGLLLGCNPEQEFHEIPIDAIAVTSGDYDRMESLLVRQLVSYQLYEGYIVGATYDPDIDPGLIALKVEGLLPSKDELDHYGALFVNSGTRGLGEYVYNGVEADDGLVSDPAVADAVTTWVAGGGALVVSDWGYDLVEACWPDKLAFVGDDEVYDDAQRGARGTVQAMVHDQALVNDLGQNVVSIAYNFSHWAAIREVGEGVTTYLSADVQFRASEAEGDITLEDAPLLVGFDHGSGHVYFSTFHWDAQTTAVSDAMMFSIVAGLFPGAGEEADTGSAGDGR